MQKYRAMQINFYTRLGSMNLHTQYMIFLCSFFGSDRIASIHRTSIHVKKYIFFFFFENSLSKYLFIELSENAERIHSFCVFFAGKKQITRTATRLAYERKTKNTRNVSRRLPRWGWYKIMNLSGRLFHNGTHETKKKTGYWPTDWFVIRFQHPTSHSALC